MSYNASVIANFAEEAKNAVTSLQYKVSDTNLAKSMSVTKSLEGGKQA